MNENAFFISCTQEGRCYDRKVGGLEEHEVDKIDKASISRVGKILEEESRGETFIFDCRKCYVKSSGKICELWNCKWVDGLNMHEAVSQAIHRKNCKFYML